MEAIEAINDSSKLIAQAIDALKHEPTKEQLPTWNAAMNTREVIEMLELALEKLTNKM